MQFLIVGTKIDENVKKTKSLPEKIGKKEPSPFSENGKKEPTPFSENGKKEPSPFSENGKKEPTPFSVFPPLLTYLTNLVNLILPL